ncbi:hypothetical protein WG915_06520 [Corynebacterium sp. H128]|uniref:hypothetical protein n=1 Tax=Corynebacterium sp. H128 TaxID=3133427 RepID=UPI0030B72A69
MLFVLLGFLYLFMGLISPKGKFLGLSYRAMPGVNTPTTNASLGAWQAAHRKVAPFHTMIGIGLLLACVYIFVGHPEQSFLLLVLAGAVIAEVPIIVLANEAAERYNVTSSPAGR